MKKYWYVWITLCSYDKEIRIVKDAAFHCTEERIREIVFDWLQKLEVAGMTYNGSNAKHHFTLNYQEAPSPEELDTFFHQVNPELLNSLQRKEVNYC